MKTLFLVCALLASAALADAQEQGEIDNPSNPRNKKKFALVCHGGAGTIERDKMTADKEREYRSGLEKALRAGYDVLNTGGSSLDATEAAVRVLEDDPHFNAGKGAVFTSAGTNELDASIMDGKTLKAGAVAKLRHIRNPITLARMLMEKSEHAVKSPRVGPLLMAGGGGANFLHR